MPANIPQKVDQTKAAVDSQGKPMRSPPVWNKSTEQWEEIMDSSGLSGKVIAVPTKRGIKVVPWNACQEGTRCLSGKEGDPSTRELKSSQNYEEIILIDSYGAPVSKPTTPKGKVLFKISESSSAPTQTNYLSSKSPMEESKQNKFLKKLILKEIYQMLNEQGTSEAPQQTPVAKCPEGQKQIGSPRPDGSLICGPMTATEKAGQFLKGAISRGTEAVQKAFSGQNTGVKTAQTVKKGPAGPSRSSVITLQRLINEWLASPKNKTELKQLPRTKISEKGEDGIYAGNTKAALTTISKEEQVSIPLNNIPESIRILKDVLSGALAKRRSDTEEKQRTIQNKLFDREPAPAPAQQTDTQFAQSIAASKARATKLEESKNWVDRTRESAAANLFERLAKDSAKKKVL